MELSLSAVMIPIMTFIGKILGYIFMEFVKYSKRIAPFSFMIAISAAVAFQTVYAAFFLALTLLSTFVYVLKLATEESEEDNPVPRTQRIWGKRNKPCGSWPSPITTTFITEAGVKLSPYDLHLDEEGKILFWLEKRPLEQGRSVVVKYVLESCLSGRIEDETPKGHSTCTMLHEYGGSSFIPFDGGVVFSEFKDQHLYLTIPDNEIGNKEIMRITGGKDGKDGKASAGGEDNPFRYADGIIDYSRAVKSHLGSWKQAAYYCVREDHSMSQADPSQASQVVNEIVAVNLSTGKTRVVAKGKDFYFNPRLSPDGQWLAYVCYNHPNMPWDQTELHVAKLDKKSGEVLFTQIVVGPGEESVQQPSWSPEGKLHFVSDRSGWYNVYAMEARLDTWTKFGVKGGGQRNLFRVDNMFPVPHECAPPVWRVGQRTYDFLPDSSLAVAFSKNGLDDIAIVTFTEPEQVKPPPPPEEPPSAALQDTPEMKQLAEEIATLKEKKAKAAAEEDFTEAHRCKTLLQDLESKLALLKEARAVSRAVPMDRRNSSDLGGSPSKEDKDALPKKKKIRARSVRKQHENMVKKKKDEEGLEVNGTGGSPNGVKPFPVVIDTVLCHPKSGEVFFIGGGVGRPAAVYGVTINLDTTNDLTLRQLNSTASGLAKDLDKRFFAIPEPIFWDTTAHEGVNGPLPEIAHGHFYSPKNPYSEPMILEDGTKEKPPLIVMAHGGPTSQANLVWRMDIQFWTSRGFAVLDVDYRGSSGHGRAYRQALVDSQGWGVVDLDDVCAGAKFLVDQGKVDGERLCITGGSAGGYTTLMALTTRSVFKAGCSKYGIGDINLLAAHTHKFESRYLDRLMGPLPEARAVYQDRSPVNHMQGLSCPVLLLQGLKDKVVPPEQAKDMYTALVAKGCPTALLEFPEEGHGFKDSKTIKRALEAELYFYGRVFGFEVSFVDPSIDSGDLNEAGYVFQKYHIDNLDDKPPEGYDFQNQ